MEKYYFQYFNYITQEEQIVFIKAFDKEEAENTAYLYMINSVGKDQADYILKNNFCVNKLDDEDFTTFEDMKTVSLQ